MIKSNQDAWLKKQWYEYWSKKKTKRGFLFKLMNHAVFGKVMIKKSRDIKLVTTERRKNHLMLRPNYHFTKFFTENLLAVEMKKIDTYI